MELRDYFLVLRKNWISVGVVTLIVLGIAAGATLLATPQYTAVNRVFFSVQGGDSVSELAQGSTFTEQQMSSYAEVATSPLVLQPVIDDLGLPIKSHELAEQLTVSVPLDTVILEIAANHEDPALAAEISNAVAAELSRVTGQLSPDRPDGSEAVRASVVEPAEPPSSPSSPNTARNLSLGLVLGLALGVGIAVLREVLDTKVRSEDDIAAVTASPVIGSIRFDEKTPSHPIVMHDDPHGQRAETYRRLRTNLQFLNLADRPNSIVVTSSVPEEGKSTTAANLAVALADAGARVILVDADLRRPSIADYVGIEGSVGLTTVLIGRAQLEDVVQPWKGTTLDVLPAGQIPPNPSELLGSRAMGALLKELAGRYDVVVIDTPPLLPVTDAAVLSAEVGGMLVVVGTDRIHKAQLRDALESLHTVGAQVLGLVLNKVAKQNTDGYAYSHDSYLPRANTQKGNASRRRPLSGAPTRASRSSA